MHTLHYQLCHLHLHMPLNLLVLVLHLLVSHIHILHHNQFLVLCRKIHIFQMVLDKVFLILPRRLLLLFFDCCVLPGIFFDLLLSVLLHPYQLLERMWCFWSRMLASIFAVQMRCVHRCYPVLLSACCHLSTGLKQRCLQGCSIVQCCSCFQVCVWLIPCGLRLFSNCLPMSCTGSLQYHYRFLHLFLWCICMLLLLLHSLFSGFWLGQCKAILLLVLNRYFG